MGDNDVVQVYVAQQPQQAHFLCNLLADSGIEARVVGEPLKPELQPYPRVSALSAVLYFFRVFRGSQIGNHETHVTVATSG